MDRRSHRISERLAPAWKRFCADVRAYRIGVLAAVLALVLMNLLFDAFCPIRILFGLPCPGCGLTRAVTLLLSGQISASFSMHPMAIPFLLLIIFFPIFRYFFPNGFTFFKIYAMIILVSTLLLFGYRMITQFPGAEPICFYEGLVPKIITALLRV